MLLRFDNFDGCPFAGTAARGTHLNLGGGVWTPNVTSALEKMNNLHGASTTEDFCVLGAFPVCL